MAFHTEAKPDVYAMIAELIEAHHPELHAAGVTVLCQMHHSKAGLKLHGYPCYATVRIVPEKDRAAGMRDARITIDDGEWHDLDDDRRRAVLDHELQHIEVKGKWATIEVPTPDQPDAFTKTRIFVAAPDGAGRPKLGMRPHDVQLGWFRAIAERHGDASVEVEQAKALVDEGGQLLFPWSGDDGLTDVERQAAEMMREEKRRARGHRLAVAATG